MNSSGYGNDGPWSALPTLEPLHSALSGLLVRTAGEGNPPAHYLTHMDYGCALTSTIAVLAALIERERSGEGQYVEVVQTVAGLYAMSDVHGTRENLVQSFAADHDQRGHAPTNAIYRTRDGWITLSCYCDEEWQGVRRALGLRSALWRQYSVARNEALDESAEGRLIEQAVASLDTAEVVRRLRPEDVPHAIISPVTVKETTNDPALQERGVMVPEHHAELGDIIEVGRTMRFGLAERVSTRPAPIRGQDTVSILKELGKSDAEIESLISSKAVFAAPVGPQN